MIAIATASGTPARFRNDVAVWRNAWKLSPVLSRAVERPVPVSLDTHSLASPAETSRLWNSLESGCTELAPATTANA